MVITQGLPILKVLDSITPSLMWFCSRRSSVRGLIDCMPDFCFCVSVLPRVAKLTKFQYTTSFNLRYQSCSLLRVNVLSEVAVIFSLEYPLRAAARRPGHLLSGRFKSKENLKKCTATYNETYSHSWSLVSPSGDLKEGKLRVARGIR